MSLKDISYLKLWWSSPSAERNHLCKFGRGIMRNNSVIFFFLNLDGLMVQEEMTFKCIPI